MNSSRIRIGQAYDYRPGERALADAPPTMVYAKLVRNEKNKSTALVSFEDGHKEWVSCQRIWRTWQEYLMAQNSSNAINEHWEKFRTIESHPSNKEPGRWGMTAPGYLTEEDLPGYTGSPIPCKNISEAWMMKLLHSTGIDFAYEPTSFIDPETSLPFFCPDLYLADYDIYLEMTTQLRKNKRKKIDRLLFLYPEIKLRVIDWNDFLTIAARPKNRQSIQDFITTNLETARPIHRGQTKAFRKSTLMPI